MPIATTAKAVAPAWGTYAKTLYSGRQPPLVAVSVEKLEEAARLKLKDWPGAPQAFPQ